MNILELMKRGAQVPEDEHEAKLPILGPCIVCRKDSKRFCGICHRLSDGQKTVPLCAAYKANPRASVDELREYVRREHPEITAELFERTVSALSKDQPTCQVVHVMAAHAEGLIGVSDPNWRG